MAANLRVLVVLPMYGGSLPIGRYVARALEEQGISLRVFEAPEFYSAFTGLRKLDLAPEQITALEHSFLQLVGQAIFAHVQSFEPHLVLALAQAPMGKSFAAAATSWHQNGHVVCGGFCPLPVLEALCAPVRCLLRHSERAVF